MSCCDKCTLVATINAVYQRDTMEHYGTDNSQVNPYEVTPSAYEDHVLSTAGKYVDKDIIVKKIPYTVTSNKTGATVYIASEVGE